MTRTPDTDDEEDPDQAPSISVHELRGWFVAYALAHAGTERERIADEIAEFIDQQRATTPAPQ